MSTQEPTITATFHPQAWSHDHAVPADPEGPPTFEVPVSDATNEGGVLLPDDTQESDLLREHENAPEWVQDWSGPFYVSLDASTLDADTFERVTPGGA